MDGSNSKNSIFDDNPEDYIDVPRKSFRVMYEKRKRFRFWKIKVDQFTEFFSIEVDRLFPFSPYRYEFVYQLVVANKYNLRSKIVIRGVEKRFGRNTFRFRKIHNVFYKPKYNQFNFQAFAYAFIENNGLRKLNFEDEDVYGKSMTIVSSGRSLHVPIQFLNTRAPLLAKHIAKQKPLPSSWPKEFFQVFHGVHVQLNVKEIRSLLKTSAKFQVLNVKRYCEQQLVRREDLKVSKKRKFKMACKYNLNILMNQLLREVKTVKKLAKLASIAIKTESMEANISKLLIAKMYKFS